MANDADSELVAKQAAERLSNILGVRVAFRKSDEPADQFGAGKTAFAIITGYENSKKEDDYNKIQELLDAWNNAAKGKGSKGLNFYIKSSGELKEVTIPVRDLLMEDQGTVKINEAAFRDLEAAKNALRKVTKTLVPESARIDSYAVGSDGNIYFLQTQIVNEETQEKRSRIIVMDPKNFDPKTFDPENFDRKKHRVIDTIDQGDTKFGEYKQTITTQTSARELGAKVNGGLMLDSDERNRASDIRGVQTKTYYSDPRMGISDAAVGMDPAFNRFNRQRTEARRWGVYNGPTINSVAQVGLFPSAASDPLHAANFQTDYSRVRGLNNNGPKAGDEYARIMGRLGEIATKYPSMAPDIATGIARASRSQFAPIPPSFSQFNFQGNWNGVPLNYNGTFVAPTYPGMYPSPNRPNLPPSPGYPNMPQPQQPQPYIPGGGSYGNPEYWAFASTNIPSGTSVSPQFPNRNQPAPPVPGRK